MVAPPQLLLSASKQGGWLAFPHPASVLVARDLADVLPLLAEVEGGLARGLWAAGFLAYEAAPAFDPALAAWAPAGPLPLAWFGLYGAPRPMVEEELPPAGECELGPWEPSTPEAAHALAIEEIRRRIARGDTYQVNYTVRLRASFAGEPWALFDRLWRAQRTAHAAWLDLGETAICSASPELFFELDGAHLVTRPMKGTAPRGRTTAEDAASAAALAASPKDRAENLMIVDMARNDLGRVARAGSVEVEQLFTIERYPSLFQMTSTVAAATDASLTEILRALFPAASITGAPKAAAMGIIRALESEPRGAYTGAIGWAAPGRRARFNVAIRTAVAERAAGRAEYGTGGGIVWDSTAEREAEECRTKALLLTQPPPRFSLLETLLWEPGRGYLLLQAHLARLADSAAYFDFPCDCGRVEKVLEKAAAGFAAPMRVRLALAGDGVPHLEAAVLDRPRPRWRVGLAAGPVASGDRLLFHKTTERALYEQALAARPDCDEVLLWNERRELTEGTRSNLVVRLAGRLWTPPVACGLLAGTFRGALLAAGRLAERILPVACLEEAEAVFLVNSLRRWVRADLVGPLALPGRES